MGKVIKRIVNIVFVAVVLLLAAYTFLMAKYPDELPDLPAIGSMLY